MSELDKVIKAWECCDPFNRRCFECPYDADCFHDSFDRVAIADMVKLLKEKQPKKGHWTPYDRYGVNDARDYECSVCKRVFSWNTDFCPMCGADMREGGDGE